MSDSVDSTAEGFRTEVSHLLSTHLVLFRPPLEFVVQANVTQEDFVSGVQGHLENIARDIKQPLDSLQREWITQFAIFAYRANLFATAGKDTFVLAKKACLYALAEITATTTHGVGKLLNRDVFDSVTAQLGNYEPVNPLVTSRETQALLGMSSSTIASLIQSIQVIRQKVINQQYIGSEVRNDSQPAEVDFVYVLAKALAFRQTDILQQQTGMHSFQLEEFERTAFNAVYGEIPPRDYTPNSKQNRLPWSALSIMLNDYFAREATWPACAVANRALGMATGIDDYNDRFVYARDLSLAEFYPEYDSEGVFQEAFPKSIKGSLENVFTEPEFSQELSQLAQTYNLISYEPNIDLNLLNNHYYFVAVRERIVVFATLVKYFSDHPLGTEQIANFIAKVEKKIGTLNVFRVRASFPPKALDKFCMEHLQKSPETPMFIRLEKRIKDTTDIRWLPLLETLSTHGTSVEKILRNFYKAARLEKANRIFAGIFVFQKAGGVPTELQLLLDEEYEAAWATRQDYKYDLDETQFVQNRVERFTD